MNNVSSDLNDRDVALATVEAKSIIEANDSFYMSKKLEDWENDFRGIHDPDPPITYDEIRLAALGRVNGYGHYLRVLCREEAGQSQYTVASRVMSLMYHRSEVLRFVLTEEVMYPMSTDGPCLSERFIKSMGGELFAAFEEVRLSQ